MCVSYLRLYGTELNTVKYTVQQQHLVNFSLVMTATELPLLTLHSSLTLPMNSPSLRHEWAGLLE